MDDDQDKFTDIRASWFDRLIPRRWHPYARLARLDRVEHLSGRSG